MIDSLRDSTASTAVLYYVSVIPLSCLCCSSCGFPRFSAAVEQQRTAGWTA